MHIDLMTVISVKYPEVKIEIGVISLKSSFFSKTNGNFLVV